MTLQTKILLALGLAVIGGTAGVILSVQASIRLSPPGVKVVAEPVFGPENKVVGTNTVYLPSKALDYTLQRFPVDKTVIDMLPKDTVHGQGLYTAADGFRVQVNAVLMGSDRTSIHKPQYCLSGSGWGIVNQQAMSIPIREPQPYELPVTRLLLQSSRTLEDGTRAGGIFVYWFVSDTRVTADHGSRMFTMGWDMLRTGELKRWAYLMYFAMCRPGQEEAAYERVKELIQATVPQYQITTGMETKLAQP